MSLNELLLRKKLKSQASIAYKFDKQTGNYYIPNQIILHFEPGTSLSAMKEWFRQWLRSDFKEVAEEKLDFKGYDNGICVVSGDPISPVASGLSPGRPTPPPPPKIDPHDFIRPMFGLVNYGIRLTVMPDSQRLTSLAKQLT